MLSRRGNGLLDGWLTGEKTQQILSMFSCQQGALLERFVLSDDLCFRPYHHYKGQLVILNSDIGELYVDIFVIT
jgi:hypothetical protein